MNREVTDVSTAAVREVLNGRHRSVVTAFCWDESPQGWAHWDYVFDGAPLTAEDRAFLESLLENEE